jgi:hypothetical protein
MCCQPGIAALWGWLLDENESRVDENGHWSGSYVMMPWSREIPNVVHHQAGHITCRATFLNFIHFNFNTRLLPPQLCQISILSRVLSLQ